MAARIIENSLTVLISLALFQTKEITVRTLLSVIAVVYLPRRALAASLPLLRSSARRHVGSQTCRTCQLHRIGPLLGQPDRMPHAYDFYFLSFS